MGKKEIEKKQQQKVPKKNMSGNTLNNAVNAFVNKDIKKARKLPPKIGIAVIVIIVLIVLAPLFSFFFGTNVIPRIIQVFSTEKNTGFEIETVEMLYSLDRAGEILGNSENLYFFYEDLNEQTDTYANGIMCYVLFSNLSEQEQIIREFTLHADGIEENLSPSLSPQFTTIWNNQLLVSIYNNGWGPSDIIEIQTRIDEEDAELISIIGESLQTKIMGTLKPGETKTVACLTHDLLHLENLKKDSIIFYPSIWYKHNDILEEFIDIPPVYVDQDVLDYPPGYDGSRGGISDYQYAIVVPTDNDSFSQSFPVYQVIPAKSTINLPIYIIPDKSCTMNFSFQFLMENEQLLESELFSDIQFKVSYYEGDFPNGNINILSGDHDPSVKKYFPYSVADKIVDPEELEKIG